MRICVLWRPGRNTELHSRFSGQPLADSSLEEAEHHRDALSDLGHTAELLRWDPAAPPLRPLVEGDHDLVFNASSLQEVALLATLGLPFAGSGPELVALDKATRKRVLAENGIPTPEHCVLHTAIDAELIPLDPPYFVKPVAGRGSQGITDESVALDRPALGRAVRAVIDGVGQAALVERYVHGIELTVGVLGDPPEALPVLEIEYADGARANTFENKQDREVFHCPARVDPAVQRRAAATALQTFRALGARDFARVDMIFEPETGRCQVLELNTFAGLHLRRGDERALHASYIGVMAERAGLGAEGVYGPILEAAARRLQVSV